MASSCACALCMHGATPPVTSRLLRVQRKRGQRRRPTVRSKETAIGAIAVRSQAARRERERRPPNEPPAESALAKFLRADVETTPAWMVIEPTDGARSGGPSLVDCVQPPWRARAQWASPSAPLRSTWTLEAPRWAALQVGRAVRRAARPGARALPGAGVRAVAQGSRA